MGSQAPTSTNTSGFAHLLTNAAAKQVKAPKIAQAMSCLDQAAIETLRTKWDWQKLSASHEVVWSVELIEQFKYYWDWRVLFRNESLPAPLKKLIKKYKNQ